MPKKRKIELLAPAGDGDALRAAVQNGADAVYLGAGSFNARRNAGNFDGEALDAAVAWCHARGVKVHVTLNTLVRQDEFEALLEAVRAVNRSGADAVIVQDPGVARALREMAPDIQLHASTQMAVHNRQGVAFLKAEGFDRVVLAREMTFGEMAECAALGIEIETFVHGALCVACSGQCLMSGMVGGRSGNRGLCAQPCRLPWRLGERTGYLLSTRDLCGIRDLARFREAGVTSLKIEGRMKRAEYVAVTVAAYRRALDALEAGEPYDPERDLAELRQMFNRGGFTRGYGPGMAESDLMYPDRPNHVGARVGYAPAAGKVRLEDGVTSGDALALRGDRGEDVPVKLAGGAGETVSCRAAKKGDGLWRLVSEAQMKRARDSFAGERRLIAVTARATLKVGRPAALEVSDGRHTVAARGDRVEAATGRGLDEQRVRTQLGKTGGTPYAMNEIELDADADAFCPASMLNALRRDALAALESERAGARREARPFRMEAPGKDVPERTLLMAQSGEIAQLKTALEHGADVAVYAPVDVRPEVLAATDFSDLPKKARLALAVPGVLTADALDGLNAWALENAGRFEMTFLSNVGQLGLAWPGRRVGDYLLNIGNDAAVRQLMDWGLEGCTPSVELNAGQIGELGGARSLVMWGRIPLMRLRHCPLRAAKGMKGPHAECRFCDSCAKPERLTGRTLTDRKGAAFPLERVAMPGGCVIRVLNSAPLMPLRRRDRLPAAFGWRLLLGPDEPVEAIVKVYRAAIDRQDFRALPEWSVIDAMQTTTGHFFRGVE